MQFTEQKIEYLP